MHCPSVSVFLILVPTASTTVRKQIAERRFLLAFGFEPPFFPLGESLKSEAPIFA